MISETFSENVIESILISQDLARAEKAKFVELHHILGSLILNKKSSAGVILSKLKFQPSNINPKYFRDNGTFYEVPLSNSSKKIIQKALDESKKVYRWNTYLRSVFILKALIKDKTISINYFKNDLDQKNSAILNEIKIFEEFAPDLPLHKSVLPPNDIKSEREIIGSILLNSQVIHSIVNILKPEYFYSSKHQDIFRCALLLNKQNKYTDLKEMRNILSKKGLLGKIGGDIYLIDLVESLDGFLTLEKQILSLKKNYLKRIEQV